MGFRLYDGPNGWKEQYVHVVAKGVGVTRCFDCQGTGLFELPDYTAEDCVACKRTGRIYVSV